MLAKFVSDYWPYGGTAGGEAAKRNSLRVAQMYDDFLSGSVEPDVEDERDRAEVESFEFALEAHLRDFLARNLEKIEPGLRLFELDGRTGIEYPLDGGRIDILAIDRGGHPVVVELKVAQGRNKALGQLLYYMGWVDQNLGRGSCRGVVIASEISTELAVAVSRVPGVTLYRYKMNFSLERTGGNTV